MVFSAGNAVFLEYENCFGLLSLVQGAFKDESPFPNPFTLSAVLLGLIRSMLRQGHGGTILVFPATALRWDKHLTSIRYRSSAPFRSLRDAIDRLQASNQLPMTMPEAMLSFQLQEGLRDSIEQVGLLTAVDGALLINSDLEVLGFGAMINSSKLNAEDKLFVFEPGKPKDVPRTATVNSLGGARHRAAADFCVLQKDAIAFVASQDGRLTVLGWLSADKKLLAIERAEMFLL
jgi:hypothetical protein